MSAETYNTGDPITFEAELDQVPTSAIVNFSYDKQRPENLSQANPKKTDLSTTTPSWADKKYSQIFGRKMTYESRGTIYTIGLNGKLKMIK